MIRRQGSTCPCPAGWACWRLWMVRSASTQTPVVCVCSMAHTRRVGKRGGKFFDKIYRIDRMGRLNGVAGSVFCTMGVPDQDPAWTRPRVETRGHFLSSLTGLARVRREDLVLSGVGTAPAKRSAPGYSRYRRRSAASRGPRDQVSPVYACVFSVWAVRLHGRRRRRSR